MKIGIFIHLFVINMFDEFCKYINNVMKVFDDVCLIITLSKKNIFFEDIIKEKYKNAHVLFIENKGVDIYSFFTQIKYIRENNIQLDYILKIHTKVCREWRELLIVPITEINSLKIIKQIFENQKIGYVATQDVIVSKYFDKIHSLDNEDILVKVIDIFGLSELKYYDFVGGTMFWINNEILEKYINDDMMSYFEKNMSYDKPPTNTNTTAPEYIFERLITGVLCYNYTNLLINCNEYLDKNHTNNLYFQASKFSIYEPSKINLLFEKKK